MSGHRLRVNLADNRVLLRVECDEPEGSDCCVICPQGCESWSSESHEHRLQPSECNVKVWSENDDFAEMCAEDEAVALHDGMPIQVEWDVDSYVWYPAEVST